MVLLSAILAAGMALAHLFSYKLLFLQSIPRSPWLSMAGGVSVAYVFLHILSELSARQGEIEETGGLLGLVFVEHHVYIMALLGLGLFYGLERAATAKRETSGEEEGSKSAAGVFWLHIASFSVYNALIGYLLLHREAPGLQSLLLYFFALTLHFVVNDYGVREDHKEDYDRIGRWILATAIFIGWGIGVVTEIPEPTIAVLFAFLAGGIVLNVLKEELPRERKSRFWAFALGAVAYAALLLAL
ncbi:MAG: hypothetical protein AVDCRST_MAG37-908 [uncultured Rubrobacteraceae bacterium]|uniref:ZIP Zinc transporter n=1 Tax=uncultured Rubrobacteraceae bacterium TaxID=349277 RepID=A0A6J4Q6D3_9ACTN|nr:MAG: hypothetical protein AVDCRST_MAG37-908 [uncultured Rubrobacteraceae bacterium]